MKINYQAIGVIRSPFSVAEGMPNQPHESGGARGTVVVFEEYAEGLCDLDGFSHIILLCHFHQAMPYKLKVIPSLGDEHRGLFATRSPNRPNPIGLSVVRLEKIVANELAISEIDILDGTPVLDIKPYVGELARLTDPRFGWLEMERKKQRSTG
jgi:tRNA-Thr(GGU) m(6)t(6)A37 methyltransferase TsaA